MANDGLQGLVTLYESRSRDFEHELTDDHAMADMGVFLEHLQEMQAVGMAVRPATQMRNRFVRELIKDFS